MLQTNDLLTNNQKIEMNDTISVSNKTNTEITETHSEGEFKFEYIEGYFENKPPGDLQNYTPIVILVLITVIFVLSVLSTLSNLSTDNKTNKIAYLTTLDSIKQNMLY